MICVAAICTPDVSGKKHDAAYMSTNSSTALLMLTDALMAIYITAA